MVRHRNLPQKGEMKITLAVFIAGVSAAQNSPPGPAEPSHEAIVCQEVRNDACRASLSFDEATKQPIYIATPPEKALPGKVTVTQLRHKPQKQALRAIVEGSKLFDAGSHQQAAGEFEKAIVADPAYSLAHDWLGVEYFVLRRFDEARKEFERAIDLDPNFWSGHYDFAVLLSQTGDLTGAELHARRALALSNTNPHVHLLLGLLLCQGAETRAEGVEHLELAARSIPEARAILANLRQE